MAKEKFEVIFKSPPVHVTANGSFFVSVSDIFHSQAGQDLIFAMEKMAPHSEETRELAAENGSANTPQASQNKPS